VRRALLGRALLAFLLSRALLFALVIAGSQIAFLQKVYSNSVWETRIDLRAGRIRPEVERIAMVGDAWFYRAIATEGYDASERVAFFPLFPMLVRLIGPTRDFTLDGILLSNAALALSLVLLGAIALHNGLTIDDAGRAMLYLAFFPTSYFLSLPVTESLFLALSLGTTLAALRGRWWAAGILGALTTATRFAGILLLPMLLVLLVERKEPRARALWLSLVPAGLLAFMWHLHSIRGDALAFVHVQKLWGRGTTPFFWQTLRDQATRVSEPWNFVALNILAAALLLAAGVHLIGKGEKAFGAYALLSAFLPLSSGSFQSMARYAAVTFPLFLWLAVRGRSTTWDRIILGASVALFGWLVAMLTLRIDFALA